MLERQALWLGNWSPVSPSAGAAAAPAQRRPILDAVTRSVLGFARQHEKPSFIWFGNFTSPIMEVLETEDEALVFTVERLLSFRPRWRVRDSEGNAVGTIRGTRLRDQLGRAMARVEALAGQGAYRWRADDGRGLGTVRHAEGGVMVTWDPCVQAFPFTKMVLLASVICA